MKKILDISQNQENPFVCSLGFLGDPKLKQLNSIELYLKDTVSIYGHQKKLERGSKKNNLKCQNQDIGRQYGVGL